MSQHALTESKAEPLYDVDFQRWAAEQARALRDGRKAEVDLENVAEEIESLGRRDRRAVRSHLEVLLAHLLKCLLQPERRTRSWDLTITAQRDDIMRMVERSPSLDRLVIDHFEADAFERALQIVARDTGLEDHALPAICPFTLEQVRDPDFFPLKTP